MCVFERGSDAEKEKTLHFYPVAHSPNAHCFHVGLWGGRQDSPVGSRDTVQALQHGVGSGTPGWLNYCGTMPTCALDLGRPLTHAPAQMPDEDTKSILFKDIT